MGRRCGAPVGIETIPPYSEFNEPSPKPCPKNILMGVGHGGGETPSGLRISLFFFMTPKGFNKAISAKKYYKSGAWTEPDSNYLPVEKPHTIRELFSIPVFPGDLWRNNP